MSRDPLTNCADWCRMNIALRQSHRATMPPGYTYSCREDFLMDRAQLWTPAPLPKRIKLGPMKACFANARRLARRSPHTYRYVEGLAVCGFFPMHHAWVVDADGHVIDNTWRTLGTEYFGAVFDLHHPDIGPMPPLDDWERRFPVFKWPRLSPPVLDSAPEEQRG